MEKQKALFAGGCFWGMEQLFRKLPGVLGTDVGYAGGKTQDPVYSQVKTGSTGHAEALQIEFNPEKISYEELLLFFFKVHDPTTQDRQGNDIGSQYRSAIFFFDESQKKTAEKVIQRVNESGAWPGPVVTQLVTASQFYLAEDDHQDYLEKEPRGYTCHFIRPLKF